MKKLITLFLLTIFHFQSCSGQNKEFVRFVVQPEAEVGKSILFNIYFEQKPDSIIVASNYVDGLELTYNLDEILKRISSSNTTDENGEIIQAYYSFESYAVPTKTGRIDLPVLTVIHEGKEYKSKPFHINVVDNITIDQNDLKVSWTSDKATYNKNDTIKVSLYEYSRFFETKRKYLPPENLPSLKGKENEIHVGFEETIDNIVGIENFEEMIDKNFEVVHFDWNPFRTQKQTMEYIDNMQYIKTMIAEFHLLAKSKGTFDIGISEFEFSLYKSNTDYFDNRFVPNDNGTYTVTDNGATKFKIKSNELKINVK
ncbi:hypothetical protein GGR32_000190 [Mesonia hippocampi]|uniref:Uncharacterized protein n=1 Tax=Mesonia hippocampi TaxID=1628250 RepID=A0A840EID0_9FLAO|nr:BatD family protein [Mesonia hippocampi]MBB4117918.1 hypothetical protein [Mesonia hippocampi]